MHITVTLTADDLRRIIDNTVISGMTHNHLIRGRNFDQFDNDPREDYTGSIDFDVVNGEVQCVITVRSKTDEELAQEAQ